MAFVPGFKHDLFISYAHTDNTRRVATDPLGWIEDLHDVLRQRLARRLGREEYFDIWWDRRLKGYEQVDPEIEEAVRQSALFLCVLSPGYVESPYCLEELQLFRDASKETEVIRRILKVKHLPVAAPREPAALKDVNGYQFYTLDDRKHPRELWRTHQSAVNETYWNLAQDVADDISDLLERMKTAGGVPVSAAAPEASLPTVYVAETAEDMAEVRLRLIRNLKQQGIRSLPETPLPSSPSLGPELLRQLRSANLAVFLVGAEFGERAFGDAEGRSLVHVQYLRAKELGLARIVWMPTGVGSATIQEERQQQFVKFLEEEHDPEARVDLQVGQGYESLVEEIVKKTFSAAGKVRPSTRPHRAGAPQVDIACQQPDMDEAMDIKKHVYQNKFDVNVAVDNGPTFSSRFQNILKRSDALLILYGKGAAEWVADRAEQARLAVRKRTRAGREPLLALVYDGPPPEKSELPFGYQEIGVVTGRSQIAKDEIVSTLKSHLGV